MGVWTTTPRTWVAGEVPTATHFNENLRDFGRAFADAWTAYTPTLTASTTSPTNWTQTGYYMQAGKLVWGKVFYTVGSTDTKSGNLVISLPVTKVADDSTFTSMQGTAVLFDTSGAARAVYFTVHNSTTAMRFVSAASATPAAASTPWTWATGDKLNATFTYEAA